MSESLIASFDEEMKSKKKHDDSAINISIYECEAIDSAEMQEAFDALSYDEKVTVANEYVEMTR
jgi:hypothetical protein